MGGNLALLCASVTSQPVQRTHASVALVNGALSAYLRRYPHVHHW